MPGEKILVIEDNPEISFLIKTFLEEAGYKVLVSDLLGSGFNLLQNQQPSLVIVDVDLPDGSGFDFCRKVRGNKPLASTPIIILTAHSDVKDKMVGFSCGADQYLTKPIEPVELEMWVKALLKRVIIDTAPAAAAETGDLVINEETQLVKYKDVTVENLTDREFRLLQILVKNKPKVLSRKYILSKIWNTVAVDHLVDTHIYNLRKKLPEALAAQIQSVPGKGFRFF